MNKEIFSKAIVTLKYRDFKLIQVIRPCQSYPDLSFREMILLWDSFLQYQAHILTLHPGILNALFIVNVTTILKIFNHFLKQSLKIIFHWATISEKSILDLLVHKTSLKVEEKILRDSLLIDTKEMQLTLKCTDNQLFRNLRIKIDTIHIGNIFQCLSMGKEWFMIQLRLAEMLLILQIITQNTNITLKFTLLMSWTNRGESQCQEVQLQSVWTGWKNQITEATWEIYMKIILEVALNKKITIIPNHNSQNVAKLIPFGGAEYNTIYWNYSRSWYHLICRSCWV